MAFQSIEQQTQALVLPIIEPMGLSLWGVRYSLVNGRALLQVFIEREGGVDADTCGEVADLLSPALDAADFIAPAYTLEVSSPGMDRLLFTPAQAKDYLGQSVRVELKSAVEGRRRFNATLLTATEDQLELGVTQAGDTPATLKLGWSELAALRLVPVFDGPQPKPGGGKPRKSQ